MVDKFEAASSLPVKLLVLLTFSSPGPLMIFPCWMKSAILNMWAPEAIVEKLPSTSLHVIPKVSES